MIYRCLANVVLAAAFICSAPAAFSQDVPNSASAQSESKLGGGDAALPDFLPPDPGEAAFETLEGVDANNNGVRDEGERALYQLHADEPQVLAIQFQGARSIDRTILFGATGDIEAAWAYDRTPKETEYVYCLQEIKYGTPNKPWSWSGDRVDDLRLLVVNTPERSAAYLKYQGFSEELFMRRLLANVGDSDEFEGQYICDTEPYKAAQ